MHIVRFAGDYVRNRGYTPPRFIRGRGRRLLQMYATGYSFSQTCKALHIQPSEALNEMEEINQIVGVSGYSQLLFSIRSWFGFLYRPVDNHWVDASEFSELQQKLEQESELEKTLQRANDVFGRAFNMLFKEFPSGKLECLTALSRKLASAESIIMNYGLMESYESYEKKVRGQGSINSHSF